MEKEVKMEKETENNLKTKERYQMMNYQNEKRRNKS
jgi:hypothetical protein